MSFNRENFNRIKQEYETKYLRAGEAAEARLDQIHSEIPEITEIDRRLSMTGSQIMGIVCAGYHDAKERIAALRSENAVLQDERKKLLEANGYPADYTDVKYECEKCGDTGYVDTKMCECMRRRLIYAGFESSGLSKLLLEQTFDNFSLEYCGENRGMAENYNTMKRFSEEFDARSGENIALFGGTGLGKTHLSSATASRIIERGFDVVYVTAVNMISDFENQRFGSGQGISVGQISRYTDCDILIIDDLGTEVTNQFTVSCIYNVINTRLNCRKSTILSTNLSQSEFRQKYWDRITSRVFGEYKLLLFSGQDVRAQKLMKK